MAQLQFHVLPKFLLFLLFFPLQALGACDGGVDCAMPGSWDDFANNLGTDLAPLLALFGEQVTKQFMSESTSWLDSVLFCLAPLGIITGMIASIRVAGSPGLRALIGRSKESRGEVEADLMSSTSADVCELWNGEGVVRVLGQPVLLQMVRVKIDGDKDKIYTFQDAIIERLYKEKGSPDGAIVESQRSRQDPPNLALNVSMVMLPRWLTYIFIGIGVVLQGGVLVYAAVVQYVLKLSNGDEPVSSYGFPLFVSGTLLLALGMFLCAEVVETSTNERIWVPTSPSTTSIIWLQQGGQTVGDQRFESFARITKANEITTSNKSSQKGRTSLVLISVGFSLVGFIAQFVALRAMHATVILAQLGAIVIMTAIRSCAHIQRDSKNDIARPEQVEGYELDWLAKNMHSCVSWEIVVGSATLSVEGDESSPLLGVSNGTSPKSQSILARMSNWSRKAKPLSSDPAEQGDPISSTDPAMAVMQARAHLAKLSKDWTLQLRGPVAILKTTLDMTMNEVYGTITRKDSWKSRDSFRWSLPVRVKLSDKSTKELSIELGMRRDRDQNEQWTPWVSNEHDLEAVMSLWVSSLVEGNIDPVVNITYLGLATQEAINDYRLWVHRQTTPVECLLSPTARYFGYVDAVLPVDVTTKHLCIPSTKKLDLLCADHIYTAFMSTIAAEMQRIGGTTERRVTEIAPEENAPTWMNFRLNNTRMATLAAIYFEAGLGTIEEGYFSIFPAFRRAGIMPSAKDACREAREAAKGCELREEWVQALEMDAWLVENKESTEFDDREVAEMMAEAEQRLLRLIVNFDRADDSAKSSGPWVGFPNRVWDAVLLFTRTQTPPNSYSYTLAWCVVWLCKNSAQFAPVIEASKVYEMGAKILQTIDLQQEHQLQIILDFIHHALENNYDTEAETLALFVWNATSSGTELGLITTNYMVSRALLSLRQKQGLFMGIEDVRRYIEDSALHDNRHHDSITVDDLRSPSISVDLQLIRPYRTPLQSAAEAGRLEVVEILLSADASAIDSAPISPHGRTALQAAAGNGHIAVVEHLLACSADIHHPAASPFGRTALQAAAEGGHIPMIELLIARKASPDELPAPCAELCINFRRRLISEEPEIKGNTILYTPARTVHTTHLGVTSLHAAARNGHSKVVELLLGASVGADMNLSSHGTALQVAAGRHPTIVKMLLNAGANVNVEADTCGGRTALQAAAEAGDIDIVQLLLQHGADVNGPPAKYHGRTALAAAAGNGLLSVVDLLLDEAADINAPAGVSFGATALQAAARGGYNHVVERLLEAGSDFNAPPPLIGGRTALATAAGAGQSEVVEILLKYPVNVSAPASYAGRTALQAAAEGGYLGIVGTLLKERAEVNSKAAPGGGRTALTAAVSGGNEEVVKMLLRAKADVNAGVIEDYGHEGLEEAAGAGLFSILEKWLREFPAPKRNGATPLGVAAGKGHAGIVEILLKEGVRITPPPRIGSDKQEPNRQKMSTGIHKRSMGMDVDAPGRGLMNPPPGKDESETLERMHPLFSKLLFNGGELEEAPIELARKGGYTDIVEMLELAATGKRVQKNTV